MYDTYYRAYNLLPEWPPGGAASEFTLGRTAVTADSLHGHGPATVVPWHCAGTAPRAGSAPCSLLQDDHRSMMIISV